MKFMPHGQCWTWDSRLILLHASADVAVAFCCAWILAIAVYVYLRGRLRGVTAAYPSLWRRGLAFIALFTFTRVCDILEIWLGGPTCWITGVARWATAVALACFAYEFWRARDDLALMGRVLESAERVTRRETSP